MSCFACTKKYGFFCKEVGCPSCGFSFCTKCLKKVIEVPKCGNQKMKVCLKCFEKLERESNTSSGNVKEDQIISIGEEAYELDEPLKPIPIPCASSNSNIDEEVADNLDSVLSQRLKLLKGDKDKELPMDKDLEYRLAALKNQKPKDYPKIDPMFLPDKRQDNEKVNDVLREIVETQALPTTDYISDIERRLANLRGDNYRPNPMKIEYTDNPDYTNVSEVVKRYVHEALLPGSSSEEDNLETTNKKSNEDRKELPWCTICNEDAVFRCKDCDDELFCSTCFREHHYDDEEYRNHRKIRYENPSKSDV